MNRIQYLKQQLSSKYCILCQRPVREHVLCCGTLCICPECKQLMETYRPGTAFAGNANIESLFAAAPYRGILRDSFLSYKFRRQEAFYEIFAQILICAVMPAIDQLQPDLVLPVPLSPARMNERGYNQAELLARKIAERFEIDYTETAVFRTRNTAKQSLLLPHQRQKNVENAFLADREKVAGKRILLIDDIFTFGATMDSCAKALLDAGAASINAAVLFKATSRNDESDQF